MLRSSATLEPPPATLGVTHWPSRMLGRHLGIRDATVARRPGASKACSRGGGWETFKFSTDPELEAKVRDVLGLYLSPPEKAIVLCVDETSQMQALNRTQARSVDQRYEWHSKVQFLDFLRRWPAPILAGSCTWCWTATTATRTTTSSLWFGQEP